MLCQPVNAPALWNSTIPLYPSFLTGGRFPVIFHQRVTFSLFHHYPLKSILMTDNQILESIRKGQPEKAVAALYRHLPTIRRAIRYYGGNRQQAEDIFQEALLIFLRKAREESFVLSSGIYPYLHSICRFLWSDEQKKDARNPVTQTDDHSAGATEDTSIAAAVAEEARYRLAESILSGLGDRCRELLQLFYTGGLKLRDIAARMGYSSEQTAKNQKYKCLETARNQYRNELETRGIL